MGNIFIKKFKLLKDDGCEIVTIVNQFSTNEKTTTQIIKQELHKDVYEILKKLAPIVRDIYQLDKEYPKDIATGELLNLAVRGVSWSCHEETGIKGACLTALVQLPTTNSPACLNTPHLPFEPYSEVTGDKEPSTFPSEGKHILRMLEEEIMLIIGNKRAPSAQTSLFEEAE